MDIKELKEQSKTLEPALRIGKFGVTPNVHVEVEKLLKRRKIAKIKVLNNCPVIEMEEIINEVLDKSKAILVSKVGNVFTIYREKKL
jgi:RNA-binding protein